MIHKWGFQSWQGDDQLWVELERSGATPGMKGRSRRFWKGLQWIQNTSNEIIMTTNFPSLLSARYSAQTGVTSTTLCGENLHIPILQMEHLVIKK